MTPYQLLIAAISGFMILSAFSRTISKKQSVREFVVWLLFWGSFFVLALWPRLLDAVARLIGIADGVRALFVVSTLFLFFSVLQLLLRVEKIEETITKLVRRDALSDLDRL